MTAPTVKKVAGWVGSLLLVAAVLLWLLRLTPLGRWVPDGLPFMALWFGLSSLIYVFVAADMSIKDKTRPDVLRRAAPSLGLTYASEGATRVPGDVLRRHIPGRAQHVMVGSNDGRELVAAIGERAESEGTEHMWCVMVELPVALPRFGINVNRPKIRNCRDWPPHSGRRWRRKPEPDPIEATFLADPSMRSWLEGLRGYHFHVDDRWVMCRGPDFGGLFPDNLSALQTGLGPVLEAAKRFVDLIPNHVIWAREGPWASDHEAQQGAPSSDHG